MPPQFEALSVLNHAWMRFFASTTGFAAIAIFCVGYLIWLKNYR